MNYEEAEARKRKMVEQFGTTVGDQIEIEHASLGPVEFPTEGEWKRAIADRKVFEEAYVVKLSEVESAEPGGQFSLSHPLRGQRFVAVPAGAIGVGFIWEIGGTKQ